VKVSDENLEIDSSGDHIIQVGKRRIVRVSIS